MACSPPIGRLLDRSIKFPHNLYAALQALLRGRLAPVKFLSIDSEQNSLLSTYDFAVGPFQMTKRLLQSH